MNVVALDQIYFRMIILFSRDEFSSSLTFYYLSECLENHRSYYLSFSGDKTVFNSERTLRPHLRAQIVSELDLALSE